MLLKAPHDRSRASEREREKASSITETESFKPGKKFVGRNENFQFKRERMNNWKYTTKDFVQRTITSSDFPSKISTSLSISSPGGSAWNIGSFLECVFRDIKQISQTQNSSIQNYLVFIKVSRRLHHFRLFRSLPIIFFGLNLKSQKKFTPSWLKRKYFERDSMHSN